MMEKCKDCYYYHLCKYNDRECKVTDSRLYEIAQQGKSISGRISTELLGGSRGVSDFIKEYENWQQATGKEKCEEGHYGRVSVINRDNDCSIYRPIDGLWERIKLFFK